MNRKAGLKPDKNGMKNGLMKAIFDLIKALLPFLSGWLDGMYQRKRRNQQRKSGEKLQKIHQAMDQIVSSTQADGAVLVLISNDGKCVDFTKATYWQIIEETNHTTHPWVMDTGFHKMQLDRKHKQRVRDMVDNKDPQKSWQFVTDDLPENSPLRPIYKLREIVLSRQHTIKIDDNVLYISVHYSSDRELTQVEKLQNLDYVNRLRILYEDAMLLQNG